MLSIVRSWRWGGVTPLFDPKLVLRRFIHNAYKHSDFVMVWGIWTGGPSSRLDPGLTGLISVRGRELRPHAARRHHPGCRVEQPLANAGLASETPGWLTARVVGRSGVFSDDVTQTERPKPLKQCVSGYKECSGGPRDRIKQPARSRQSLAVRRHIAALGSTPVGGGFGRADYQPLGPSPLGTDPRCSRWSGNSSSTSTTVDTMLTASWKTVRFAASSTLVCHLAVGAEPALVGGAWVEPEPVDERLLEDAVRRGQQAQATQVKALTAGDLAAQQRAATVGRDQQHQGRWPQQQV